MGNATWPEIIWTTFGIGCVSLVAYYWWLTIDDYRYVVIQGENGNKLYTARALSTTAGLLLLTQLFFLAAGLIACLMPPQNLRTPVTYQSLAVITLLIFGQASLGVVSIHLNRSYWVQVRRMIRRSDKMESASPDDTFHHSEVVSGRNNEQESET